ncbi:MAG: hypothetical protein ABIJ97_14405 [Bacteroidota bacterium]
MNDNPEINLLLNKLISESEKYSDISYLLHPGSIYKTGSVKIVLITDNPALNDKISGYYLSGRAGKTAKKVFENYPIDNIKYSEILILPKCHIIAENNDDLKKIKNTHPLLFNLSQQYLANIIYEIFKSDNNCRFWFLQTTGVDPELFSEYYWTLKNLTLKNENFYKKCFFFNHFSGNHFELDMLRYFYMKCP